MLYANQPQKTKGNILPQNWKAHAKIRALLMEKISPEKATNHYFDQSCTKSSNCINKLKTYYLFLYWESKDAVLPSIEALRIK